MMRPITEIYVVIGPNREGDPQLQAGKFSIGRQAKDMEGIVAAMIPGIGLSALVTSFGPDDMKYQLMATKAQQVSSDAGKRLEIVRFVTREHVEWIKP